MTDDALINTHHAAGTTDIQTSSQAAEALKPIAGPFAFAIFAMRPLQEMIYKPSQSLAMSFARDPNPGLMGNRFSGPAIVFLATTTFTTQSTAAFAMHTTAFR